MRVNTRKRRNARRIFEQMYGRQELIDRMYQIISKGKQGLDAFLLEVGRMMAETIMYILKFNSKRYKLDRQQLLSI